MKCKNCGGNVSVNDLKCPYCGTPNPEGMAFQKEVHKKKRFNEYLREEIMEQMYEDGLYGELDYAMESWNLDASDYPEYTQMTILNYYYQQFQVNSMNCIQAMDQGLTPDDYDLEYSVKNARKLLKPDIPAYPDIYPENQEQLSIWQEEALIYLIGILDFTEEDLKYDE